MRLFAELGLNHLGSSKLAIATVKKCLKMDIDGITLQIQPESYYDNSKKFRRQLSLKTYEKISKVLKKKKKLFGLAIADTKTLEKFKKLKFNFLKILSFAFDDRELIKRASNTRKELFVSTGISDLKSINQLAKKYPKINFIHTSLSNKAIDVNLLAIKTIKEKIKNKVSYGLHCLNHEVMLSSVAFFPDSLFFYIKPNEKSYYPDDKHAIILKNLPKMLKSLKITKQSMGDGSKSKKNIPEWVFE